MEKKNNRQREEQCKLRVLYVRGEMDVGVITENIKALNGVLKKALKKNERDRNENYSHYK